MAKEKTEKKSPPKRQKLDKDTACRLEREGMNDQEIADKYGIPFEEAKRIRKRG